MVKTVVKEYQVYDYNDLKNNDELFDKCYDNWLSNPDNINCSSDENINSFTRFAGKLNMKWEYSLSNAEYPDRNCHITLKPDYWLDNNDMKEILKDYKGNGYYICDILKDFTLELLDQEQYKTFYEWNTKKFVLEIENKMLDLWFEDNQDYFSKENFSQLVECNEYEFYENGDIA